MFVPLLDRSYWHITVHILIPRYNILNTDCTYYTYDMRTNNIQNSTEKHRKALCKEL